MFSQPMTRRDLEKLVVLSGKELTARICQEKSSGQLIARKVCRDPVRGVGKQTIYQFVARTLDLPFPTEQP